MPIVTRAPERCPPLAAGPVLLGTLIASLVAGRLETALGCVALASLTAAWAGAGWIRPRDAVMLGMGAATAIVLNVFLVRGAPLFALPGAWAGSREGLAAGSLFALRLAGAGLSLHGLRSAWPGERAADELAGRAGFLERVHVPVRTARAVVGLALRFAPLVAAEARRISALQEHRAGGVPRGRGQWVIRCRALVVPLMICTLERAERVALGMEARHYRVRPVARVPRSFAAEAVALGVVAVSIFWRS